jgi:hypothetical protein
LNLASAKRTKLFGSTFLKSGEGGVEMIKKIDLNKYYINITI